jgi:hypothetical protein
VSSPPSTPALSSPAPTAGAGQAGADIEEDDTDLAETPLSASVKATGATKITVTKAAKQADERILRMPAVVGVTLPEARALMRQARITEYTITPQSTTKADEGIVFKASHAKDAFLGTADEPATDVVLFVSAGRSREAFAAEAGTQLAGTLAAMGGFSLSSKSKTKIRQAFGVFSEPGEKISSARPAPPGSDSEDDLGLGLDLGGGSTVGPPGANTGTGTAVGTAAGTGTDTADTPETVGPVSTASASALREEKQRISTDALDLDELADRLYSRLRRRLAGELRNDRARVGMLSDYR